jgi:mannose-6-phosphate isomerase-like protein (cupin superfamily)
MRKVNLSDGFASFTDTWSPRHAGSVNNIAVKLAKFSGEFVRHHHETEDELFLVVRGRLPRNEQTVTELGRIGQP